MKTQLYAVAIAAAVCGLIACNRSKPKPISNDISKTTVTVGGKKDSVINNPQKNYGNATIADPCVKTLVRTLRKTDGYKIATIGKPAKNIIYEVNWITSTKPKAIGSGVQIINGMEIAVLEKRSSEKKRLTSFVYNNAEGRLYVETGADNYTPDVQIDTASLKKIRNSCFWGVASSK